ncbi:MULTISPECIES: glutaredoxin family protein [Microbacterium]|uniref:glutaredoxin family protein n=1 Tax=Microbacterium TaxID=33882 RepID=UPI001469BA48|nr:MULTISPECIES: glutaredoxin family protein [Microbacterium]
MTSVTVYSAGPACVQCRQTFKHLERRGVDFTEVDLRATVAALEYVTDQLGYSQAPVVVVDDEPENHWYGFRPDLIDRLAIGRAS